MGRQDWYRNEIWTPEVKAVFFERLSRSRGEFHKAQYLRIQASYLVDSQQEEAGLGLLDYLLSNYPHPTQLARARGQRAKCLLSLGRTNEALDEYRRSLQAERDFPTCRGNSWLEFAYLVAEHDRQELFDEASSVLDEFESPSSLVFPVWRFKHAVARALIADARAQPQVAREFAHIALAAAKSSNSGFRRHPGMGLVGSIKDELQNRLLGIARQ